MKTSLSKKMICLAVLFGAFMVGGMVGCAAEEEGLTLMDIWMQGNPGQEDYITEMVGNLSREELAGRQWPKVKIPGYYEQQREAVASGRRTWRNISPGYVNVPYDIKIDGSDVTVLLDGAGLAQSHDGGKSWESAGYGIQGTCYYSFDISPVDKKLMVVAGPHLCRSEDGGKTWIPLMEKNLPPAEFGHSYYGNVKFNADGSRIFTAQGGLRHMFSPRGSWEKEFRESGACKTIYVGDLSAHNFVAVKLDSPFAGGRRICPHPENPDVVYISFGDGELYVTRNATAKAPPFKKVNAPEGYQIVSMDVSPWDPSQILMAMLPLAKKGKPALMRVTDTGTTEFKFETVPVLDAEGKEIFTGNKLVCAKWNPHVKGQVFVGAQSSYLVNYIMVSDDFLKTFRKIAFPEHLKHDEPLKSNGSSFYSNPFNFYFSRNSDLAITTSCIGAWSSRDQFKTWENLFMTYDDDTKLYGNKGVGFAECAVSIKIRQQNAYMAIKDHGVFRSNGLDYTHWSRISNNPGIPLKEDGNSFLALAWPVGVSHDEKYVYLVARASPYHYSSKKIKVLRSLNKGDSWQDVTSRFGQGDVMSFGKDAFGITHHASEMIFDPDDSQNQWALFSTTLFISRDGGETFHEAKSPVFNRASRSYFREICFDPTHKILYIGNHFTFAGGASLARSFDYGETWEEVDFGIKTIFGLNVTDSGNLVIGVEGKLIVVPFDKIDGGKIEPSMVKMTTGDTPDEYAASQMDFRPIECDGENIIAFVHSWKRSTIKTNKGPLLSEDGGKTFRWIAYDIPCAEGTAAAIGDGNIIVGNRGVHYWKYK